MTNFTETFHRIFLKISGQLKQKGKRIYTDGNYIHIYTYKDSDYIHTYIYAYKHNFISTKYIQQAQDLR